MPLRPKCADTRCKETHVIEIFIKGATCKELWLHVKHVEWLLAYAADEIAFQCVECPNDDPAVAEKKGNCEGVPDLHIAWDFQSKTYKAEFLGGPIMGFTSRIDPVDTQLTAKIWDTFLPQFEAGGGELHLGRGHSDAPLAMKKQVAKFILQELCAARLHGGYGFIAKNGLESLFPDHL